MRRLSCHIGADPSQTVPSCAMCVALATGAMPSQSEQVSVGQLGQARRHVLPQARPSRRIAIRFVENETKSCERTVRAASAGHEREHGLSRVRGDELRAVS